MSFMKSDFSGKTALVIGGSGGIGAAVSVELGRLGAELVVHGGRSEERLSGTVSAVRAAGGKARGFLLPLDGLTAPEAVPLLLAELPRPDILVCAWGDFFRKGLRFTRPEDWERAVFSNLILPGALVSAVLGAMMEKAWGRILLFGGTNTDALRGYRSTAAYSCAKAALGVLAKSAALEASGSGVTCNVFCPGFVDTEYLDEEARRYAAEHAPGGRLIPAAELARLALDVAKSGAVNGAVVPIDGGLRI